MKTDNEVYKPVFPAILRGILTSAAITLSVLLVCAAVMTLGSGISEKAIYIAVHITSLAAVFAGSLTAASHISRRGLVNGVLIGLIYAFSMLFIGYMITPDFAVGAKTAVTFAISVLSGALGGILGVNIKRAV